MKNTIKISVSLIIGAICCYFFYTNSLKGISKELNIAFAESLTLIPYFILVLVFYFLALLCRAHRWMMMMGRKDVLWLCFRSVAIGYTVSLFVSKLGEVSRMLNQKKYSDSSVGELVSTALIDRLLDVFMLILCLIFSFSYGNETLQEHFPEFSKKVPVLSALFLVGLIFLASLFIYSRKILSLMEKQAWIPPKLKGVLLDFFTKFLDGLKFMKSPTIVAYMFLSSFMIWGCYLAMFYFSFNFFSVFEDKLDLGKHLFAFTCSTLGMLIPTPGGLGSYHIFTAKGFEVIFNISAKEAASVTSVGYFVQIFIPNVLFGVSFLLWGFLFSYKRIVKAKPEVLGEK